MAGSKTLLKEWAPLTDLLLRLPSKVPVGLLYREVKLTCIDALPEFLALGTNLGIVYWYNRRSKELQKLKCETTHSPITSVKITSTVDYMVACGNNEGLISIFQIPKQHPESIPESLKPKIKCVERYTVSELHKGPITALEWSKNGMKLFSGDKDGIVVLTELDFYMHLCKSAEILNESYEVVQLSYNQQNLLISTTYRSIMCQQLDKWNISQVGKKDRKVLGRFGGIFHNSGIYCTRPGHRIWISDIHGCVQHTLLFKELINSECPEVSLINPISESARKLRPQMESTFGILLPFGDDFLITYNNDVVYILDPKNTIIIAAVSNLRRVISVSTTRNEIFILEGDKSLIRLSNQPEIFEETKGILNNLKPTSPSGLKIKFQVSNIISAFPSLIESPKNGFSVYTDPVKVTSAEEALESPEKRPDSTKFEAYNKIGELNFEDTILYKHHKKRKQTLKKHMSNSVTSLTSSSSDDVMCTEPMAFSAFGVLPDLRSPDSIRNDIEYKEKILADVLNFDRVKVKDMFNEPEQVKKDDVDNLVNEKEESGNLGVSPQSSREFCIKPNIFTGFGTSGTRVDSSDVHEVHKLKNAPACLNIPSSWKLSELQLHNNIERSIPSDDASLADWEIL